MSRLRRIWPPLALTLLALAVRLHNLTYHSLWFDEAMSVHWARSSVARILEVSMHLVEDRLPPLYYLALHYWRLLVGDGEVAVRLPSVLLGSLLVPLVYRLANDWFSDRRVALLAAALTAFNPFLVWYSQETRMYAQAVLLATLGTWLFCRGVASRIPTDTKRYASTPYWLGYGLCALAGLYTHLYTAFLLPAHALYLLIDRRSRRAWLPFLLTMLVVALLFAPLALAAWRASGEADPGNPLTGFWARAWWLLSGFSVWKAPLSPALNTFITVALGGFAVVGFIVPHRPAPSPTAPNSPRPATRNRTGQSPTPRSPHNAAGTGGPRLLVALLLLTPVAIATLLLFRNQVAFFGERYFIVSVPWLLIAAAAGAVNLATRLHAIPLSTGYRSFITRRLLPVTCYLLPVIFSLLPLPGQWSTPARREAWRETVGYLATHARPEDAILIHPDWTRYPLQYYFRGPGQTYAVFGSVEADTDVDGPLTVISGSHPVVWLVESHTEMADPDHRVNAWLAARYPLVTELYPPGLVAVRAYAPGYMSDRLPGLATPVNAAFEGGLRLAGYVIPQSQVRVADDLFHPPSAWVHITLYWTVESPPTQNYTPFVHLIDDRGQVWGASLERSNDVFGFYPTTRWEPAQVVRADFDVNLNPIIPPGRYELVVGLRDASGMQAPLVDGSPQVPLTAIEVVDTH